MKIVITGKPSMSSWLIRGQQLGAAIGARIARQGSEFRDADIVICVKRVLEPQMLRRRFWVYDVVDAWPQPAGNHWDESRAVAWLRGELERLRPSAVVFPTSAMHLDSGWTGPSIVLPHHAWPRYRRPNTVKAQGQLCVGYEGGVTHLGSWQGVLERECAARRWRFQVNADMRDADIGIALREASGHPPRRWKSNVKLANLQALGIPAICSPEQGYIEFGSGMEILIEDLTGLREALDRCAQREFREEASARMPGAAPRLEEVAGRYRAWLSQLNS